MEGFWFEPPTPLEITVWSHSLSFAPSPPSSEEFPLTFHGVGMDVIFYLNPCPCLDWLFLLAVGQAIVQQY